MNKRLSLKMTWLSKTERPIVLGKPDRNIFLVHVAQIGFTLGPGLRQADQPCLNFGASLYAQLGATRVLMSFPFELNLS